MTDAPIIHPDSVYEALLEKGGRANRRAALLKLHELCRRRQASGERDFSVASIGRAMEADGIMKGRVLYNAQSADYRQLISAWASFSGPSPMPKQQKALASADYLQRIDDPAIRSLMQAIVAERDKLRAQLNLLKANTMITVDRRPEIQATSLAYDGQVVSALPKLTESERDALRKAVSADYLAARSLSEGSYGEIVNERGRMIFEFGFAKAIRKVLQE